MLGRVELLPVGRMTVKCVVACVALGRRRVKRSFDDEEGLTCLKNSYLAEEAGSETKIESPRKVNGVQTRETVREGEVGVSAIMESTS